MGAKMKSKTHLLNTFFDFLSRFLCVLLQSLKKVLIWSKNFFFLNWKRCQKTQNFTLISNLLKKLWKMHQKVWQTWVKVKKVHFSVTFLLITFFWYIFSKFFQRIRNQREILRFLTPFPIFSKNIFLKVILVLFSNFDCKCPGNGSKKRKIFFYDCILEFNYATIKGFA